MIVVDTSIWIDHLHRTEPDLALLLERELVAVTVRDQPLLETGMWRLLGRAPVAG